MIVKHKNRLREEGGGSDYAPPPAQIYNLYHRNSFPKQVNQSLQGTGLHLQIGPV